MFIIIIKWIKFYECCFYGCVDEDVFYNLWVILFNFLDVCWFELMWFRIVFVEKILFFIFRIVVSVNGVEVEV